MLLASRRSAHVNHLTRAVGEQGAQRSLSHTLRHEQRLVGLHAEVLLAHRSLSTFRVDAVDADAVGIPPLRHSLHKVDNGSLCRRVDAVESATAGVRAGSKEDEIATCALQVRTLAQSHVNRAHIVGLHSLQYGVVLHRSERLAVEHAGGVDDVVDVVITASPKVSGTNSQW